MASPLARSQKVRIKDLTSRDDLNGSTATVVRWDGGLERWRVRTPDGKCLALKRLNLEPISSDSDFESPAGSAPALAPPAPTAAPAAEEMIGSLVTVKGGRSMVKLVIEASTCGTRLLVRAEGGSGPVWIDASKAAPLAAAPDETVPTEFLHCRVEARSAAAGGRSSGGKQPRPFGPADVVAVRIDPAGRLRFQVLYPDGSHGWLLQTDLKPAEPLGKDISSSASAAAAASPGSGQAGKGQKGKGKAGKAKKECGTPGCSQPDFHLGPCSPPSSDFTDSSRRGKGKGRRSGGEAEAEAGAAAGAEGAVKEEGWEEGEAGGGEAGEEEPPLSTNLSCAELRRRCEAAGVGTSGNKETMIKRLRKRAEREGDGGEAAASQAKARRKVRAPDDGCADEEGEGEGREGEEGGAGASTSRGKAKRKAAAGGGGEGGGEGDDEQGRVSKKWRKENAHAQDAWEEALNALQPDSDAEEGAEAAPKPAAAAAASASSSEPAAGGARDPRLQGFRIGGQAETAEEKGEGWCGPWATARALLDKRAAALAERQEELGGEAPPPLVEWSPKREYEAAAARRRRSAPEPVPTLQALATEFVCANIDCVEDFGALTPAVQHALATELCRRRLFRQPQLRLLAPPGLPLSELVAPDCHQIDEQALHETLEPLACPDSRLALLSLGFCGKCVTTATSQLIARMGALESLTLTGAYRLTDGCVAAICGARGAALRSLKISGNQQLTAAFVASIASECDSLERLALEDLIYLPGEAAAPIGRLTQLQSLSFRGTRLLVSSSMLAAVGGSAHCLEALDLGGCTVLSADAVATAAEACPRLRELSLDGVENLTDDALGRIAAARRGALSSLSLRKCVQLSDGAIEGLAAACGGVLVHLSLNNVPALGDACLVALKEHCADSLESLDLSWCRAVSDNGVGALVDAAPRLQRLTVWGCSQLTNRFYEGHSREHLRVVGRSI